MPSYYDTAHLDYSRACVISTQLPSNDIRGPSMLNQRLPNGHNAQGTILRHLPKKLDKAKNPGDHGTQDKANSLKCWQCGKVYKHKNCLIKHYWEHHESWESTKHLCQTKHQQVQLLEAAQVLVDFGNMNK